MKEEGKGGRGIRFREKRGKVRERIGIFLRKFSREVLKKIENRLKR